MTLRAVAVVVCAAALACACQPTTPDKRCLEDRRGDKRFFDRDARAAHHCVHDRALAWAGERDTADVIARAVVVACGDDILAASAKQQLGLDDYRKGWEAEAVLEIVNERALGCDRK